MENQLKIIQFLFRKQVGVLFSAKDGKKLWIS